MLFFDFKHFKANVNLDPFVWRLKLAMDKWRKCTAAWRTG